MADDFLIRAFHRYDAVKTGGPFKLASGRESDLYVDCKRVLLAGAVAGSIACKIAGLMSLHFRGVRQVAADEGAGLLLGAVLAVDPDVSGELSHLTGLWLRRPKDHGLCDVLTQGPPASDPRVVILEDVTTTGGSALRVAEVLRNAGFSPVGVLAVVDREEGAKENLAAKGLALWALVTRGELLAKQGEADAGEAGVLAQRALDHLIVRP